MPTPMSPTAGEFVTESFAYDGGRNVTVFVPADPVDSVVFAGDAGARVTMAERAGSHGDAFWFEEFPLMASWAFGA